MPSPLDVEALFVAIGLQSILDARPTLHKYQLQQAAEVPAELRRRVLRFMASDTFAEGKDVPPFDFTKTLEQVSAGQTPKQTHALAAAIPDHELALDLGIQASRITTWANGIIPRDSRPVAGGGSISDEPTGHTLADFRRVWHVAADPMIVLDDLEDGSLSDDQVGTLALLYPALYMEIRQAVSDDMATMRARKGKDWEPSPTKGQLLGTLLQADPTDPDLTATMQTIYANDPEAAPKPPPRRPGGSSAPGGADLTPGQKAAGA